LEKEITNQEEEATKRNSPKPEKEFLMQELHKKPEEGTREKQPKSPIKQLKDMMIRI
jgi:hypothetical protein